MNAKEYLKQIRKSDRLISNKQQELDVIRSKLEYSGISYEEKVQCSIDPDSRVNSLLKVIEYEHEINKQIDELIQLKLEVMKVVDQVQDGELVDLLYQRYFQFKTFEEIAITMNYTWRWTMQMHNKALKEVDKIINKTSY